MVKQNISLSGYTWFGQNRQDSQRSPRELGVSGELHRIFTLLTKIKFCPQLVLIMTEM